jgi:hypothetical protein
MSDVGFRGSSARSKTVRNSAEIRNPKSEILFSVLLSLLTPAAFAQTTQALISGRAIDVQTGNPVRKAEIACEGMSITPPAVRSDDSGYFVLPLLSPGRYKISVGAANYQPQEVYELDLAVASRIDFVFRLRPLSDVWEQGRYRSVLFPDSESLLTFFGPDLDLSRSSSFESTKGKKAALETTISEVIDAEQVRRLPLNGRDVYTMLVTQPGVTSDAATGRGLGLSVNGQRPSASNFMLDGLENNNYLVTGPLTAVAPEAVEEYRISTNNFSAEYGRTSGYLANAITRAGGSHWHGIAYFYGKNESLNANGFAENANGFSRRGYKESQPGFSIGGPLLANRLFISGSFEYLRLRTSFDPRDYRLPNSSGPPPSGPIAARLLQTYPSPAAFGSGAVTGVATLAPPSSLDRYLALPRLDYLSKGGTHRITARAAVASVSRPDFFWTPYKDFITPLTQDTLGIAATSTYAFRPNWTNEARFGWSSDDLRFDRPHPEVPDLVSSDRTTLPGSDAFYSFRNRSRSFEVVENLIWARGRHIFKFGGEALVRRIDGYLTAGRDSLFNFGSFDAFAKDSPFSVFAALTRQNGRPLTTPDYQRQYRYNQSYLFAQDSFKLSSRLVVDYGVRYERFGAPTNTGPVKDAYLELPAGASFVQRLAAAKMQYPLGADQRLYDPDNNNLAARAGFSYSLRRNGSTILRGSYGIFYDRPFDNLWQNLRNNNLVVPLFTLSSTISGTPIDYLQPVVGVLQTVPNYRNSSYPKLFPEVTMYQPDLRDGYVQSYFFGVQQQVTRDFTLELNTLGSLGRKLITTDVVNRDLSIPFADRPISNLQGRFNPSVAEVSYRSNQGSSNYNAFTAVGRYRAHRTQVRVAYTWGHAIDNQSEPLAGEFFDLSFTRAGGGISGLGRAAFSRQFDSRGDRGNSDFDQTHNLTFTAIWELPTRALRGWSVAALGGIRSGFPYSVNARPTAGLFDDATLINLRADLVDPGRVDAGRTPADGGVHLLNGSAFRTPAAATQGNTGRNAFRGPGLASVDLSLARTFGVKRLGESGRFTVRADAFNFLNHANLNNPNSFLNSSTFGVATYGRQGRNTGFPAAAPLNETARQIQLLLRVEF